MEEALKAKRIKSVGTNRPSYKCCPPLVRPTCCRDYLTGVNDMPMHLMNLSVDVEGEYVLTEDAGKFTIQARETERLRSNLSLVMQKAIGYRKLGYQVDSPL